MYRGLADARSWLPEWCSRAMWCCGMCGYLDIQFLVLTHSFSHSRCSELLRTTSKTNLAASSRSPSRPREVPGKTHGIGWTTMLRRYSRYLSGLRTCSTSQLLTSPASRPSAPRRRAGQTGTPKDAVRHPSSLNPLTRSFISITHCMLLVYTGYFYGANLMMN